MTTLHEVAKSNNCKQEVAKSQLMNEGTTNLIQLDSKAVVCAMKDGL